MLDRDKIEGSGKKCWIWMALFFLLAIILYWCVCKLCKGQSNPSIYKLMHQKVVARQTDPVAGTEIIDLEEVLHSQLFLKDEATGYLVSPLMVTIKGQQEYDGVDNADPFSKTNGLKPECFASEPVMPKQTLGEIPLTEKNTTIILLNFNKDGRLESRVLPSSSTSTDLGGDVVKAIRDEMSSAGATGTIRYPSHMSTGSTNVSTLIGGLPAQAISQGRYMVIREILAKGFDKPIYNQIQSHGLSARNLNSEGVPSNKTPFYEFLPYDNDNNTGAKDHAFFFVLLDENLKFNRVKNTPTLLPYTPGTLHSPYIEYPHMDPGTFKNDVMVVHFHRGNDMASSDKIKIGATCRYPYDIAVVADAQQISAGYTTPLLIDPEVESDGPIQ